MNESSNLSSLPYNIPNDPLNFLSEDPLDFLSNDNSNTFMHYIDEGQLVSGQNVKSLDIQSLDIEKNPERATALAAAGFVVKVHKNEIAIDPKIFDKFKSITQINVKDENGITKVYNDGQFTIRKQTKQEMLYIANKVNLIAQNVFNQKINEKNSNTDKNSTSILTPTYSVSYN